MNHVSIEFLIKSVSWRVVLVYEIRLLNQKLLSKNVTAQVLHTAKPLFV